jgi:hypothetical protein
MEAPVLEIYEKSVLFRFGRVERTDDSRMGRKRFMTIGGNVARGWGGRRNSWERLVEEMITGDDNNKILRTKGEHEAMD